MPAIAAGMGVSDINELKKFFPIRTFFLSGVAQ
jgi:hypothetical protein